VPHKKSQQGGGAEGERKSKKSSMRHKKGGSMNTMGLGQSSKQMTAEGSMGRNQKTGDGGAAK